MSKSPPDRPPPGKSSADGITETTCGFPKVPKQRWDQWEVIKPYCQQEHLSSPRNLVQALRTGYNEYWASRNLIHLTIAKAALVSMLNVLPAHVATLALWGANTLGDKGLATYLWSQSPVNHPQITSLSSLFPLLYSKFPYVLHSVFGFCTPLVSQSTRESTSHSFNFWVFIIYCRRIHSLFLLIFFMDIFLYFSFWYNFYLQNTIKWDLCWDQTQFINWLKNHWLLANSMKCHNFSFVKIIFMFFGNVLHQFLIDWIFNYNFL